MLIFLFWTLNSIIAMCANICLERVTLNPVFISLLISQTTWPLFVIILYFIAVIICVHLFLSFFQFSSCYRRLILRLVWVWSALLLKSLLALQRKESSHPSDLNPVQLASPQQVVVAVSRPERSTVLLVISSARKWQTAPSKISAHTGVGGVVEEEEAEEEVEGEDSVEPGDNIRPQFLKTAPTPPHPHTILVTQVSWSTQTLHFCPCVVVAGNGGPLVFYGTHMYLKLKTFWEQTQT